MTAASMLAEARKWLGTRGRPNGITRAYSSRNGNAFLRAPWCDMAVTEWARRTGNYDAVCMGTDYAYTVWHAQRFQQAGRWHWGTSGARPGDIVFFSWEGGRSIGRIDHVGIVEKNLGGGRLQTIEGNTGDACLRRVRSGSVITGYGRPNYGASGGVEDELIGLKKGDQGERVTALQALITYAGGKLPRFGVDGDYGDETAEALRQVRKSVGSEAKTGWGDTVTGYAYAQLMRAVAKNS